MCCGQAYDGASIMSGHFPLVTTGLQSRVKELNSLA